MVGVSTTAVARFACDYGHEYSDFRAVAPEYGTLETAQHLIDAAKSRAARGEFKNRDGVAITPEFRCQSIAERLEIEDNSIDLAISGGVVGLYLSTAEARSLIAELKRIVKPGGYIALDAGPAVPVDTLRGLAEGAGFVYDGKAKSFVIEPRPKLIFRKPA